MDIKKAIETGAVDSVISILNSTPELSNQKITWGEDDKNRSDPLHFVSDCFFTGKLANGREGDIAEVLISHGAAINGSDDAETPLIGATSLGANRVARVLIDADADLDAIALFGATALHWAAYMGMRSTVEQLISRGAKVDVKCNEFASTPLFWAVQGYSRYGPDVKDDQVGAAAALINAGADLATCNCENTSLIDRAQDSVDNAMTELLSSSSTV